MSAVTSEQKSSNRGLSDTAFALVQCCVVQGAQFDMLAAVHSWISIKHNREPLDCMHSAAVTAFAAASADIKMVALIRSQEYQQGCSFVRQHCESYFFTRKEQSNQPCNFYIYQDKLREDK